MYDLIVIGGGPGGYAAATLGAKKGLNVLLVEKERVGGVCLNRGCIPAKTLISYARTLNRFASAKKKKIFDGEIDLNWINLQNRKNKVVDTLVTSVEKNIKKLGGDIIRDKGRLLSSGVVEMGNEVFESKNILIAIGSTPLIPEKWGELLSGETAFDLTSLPEKVIVVGGGVIGVETAYWLRSFGVDVEIVEMMPVLVPGADEELSKILLRELKKIGVKVHLSSPVEGVEKVSGGYVVKTSNSEIEGEKVVVALGRRPATGWDGQFIDKDEHGWVKVDEFWRTSMPGHFAVGDITGRGMLAHTAYFGAEQVIRMIVGETPEPFDPLLVPKVVFTEPEIAWVGLDEVQLKGKNINYEVARFQMRWTGRALAEDALAGMVKVYYSSDSKEILGVHIAGGNAGEMIHAGVVALKNKLKITDMEKLIFTHPTFSEAIGEAFQVPEGWNIHGE